MNLLIVDDEYYSVEGLKNSCVWDEYGIENVLCAYSFKQAQEIFMGNVIDIMLADIEMPHGSGIELLQWLNNQNYNTITIFLTSHAKYEYVSLALKLGAVDYLLKPINEKQLHTTLQKAITIKKEKDERLQEQKYANSWKRNKNKLIEQCWLELLSYENIDCNKDSVIQILNRYHVSEQIINREFYLAVLNVFLRPDNNLWTPRLYSFSIKNIINEYLLQDNSLSTIVSCSDSSFFICTLSDLYENFDIFHDKCNSLIQNLSCILPGDFRIYLSHRTGFFEINANYQKLNTICKNDIYTDSAVIIPEKILQFWCVQRIDFNWKKFSDYIGTYNFVDALKYIDNYFIKNQTQHFIDRNYLSSFVHNFLQIIYTSIEKLGYSANDLFCDTELQEAFEHVFENISSMRVWIDIVLNRYQKYIKSQIQEDSPIEIVKQYIQEHLAEDLNRELLAELVYLSPDHLSHLFKQKCGDSLSSWIIHERIDRAKKLLMNPKFRVSDVAIRCGFSNTAYFSKLFYRETGTSPREYKKMFYAE